MRAVHVVGGGPAGVMAAVAAMREGAGVRIFEKSAFPRHKVCGEFLSPAILPLLRRAGCEAGFLQLRPSILSAMRLHFGTRVIRHPLPEPYIAEAERARAEVVSFKEKLKALKTADPKDKKIEVLETKIWAQEKAAREAKSAADAIDAAVFDVKAVNTNAIV